MKILHTSDWHLGRVIYGRSLLEDQQHFIDSFLFPQIKSKNPDAIILSGDIFDRSIAPVEAIRLFDSFLVRLGTEYKIPLIAVSGNHDSPDRLCMGTDLLKNFNINIITKVDTKMEPIILGNSGNVHVYALPYFEPALARDIMAEDLRGFEESYSAVLANIKANLDKSVFNILVSHCFVVGSDRSDSESPAFVGGGGEIPSTVFDGFDYVALGHLHRAQGKNIRYSGSPLKYSFDEQNHNKSVTIIETGDKLIIKDIPVPPLHDMVTLKGTIEEVLAMEPSENYVLAELSGPPVFEPMAKLRKVFPNILGITRKENATVFGKQNSSLLESNFRIKDEEEIFKEFMKTICGDTANDEDIALFKKAYGSYKREEI